MFSSVNQILHSFAFLLLIPCLQLCVLNKKKKLEGLSGHEYLKKIINLPFCIPRLHYKKVKMNYVHELLNQSTERGKKGKSGITKQRMSYEDLTARGLITQSHENIDEEQSVNSEVNVLPQDNRQTIPKVPAADESPGGSGITKERPNRSDLLMVPVKRFEDAENEQPGLSVKTTTIVRRTSVSDQPPASSKHTSINQEADFGVKCRKELHSCAELLHDNPRNIKRIYNILTLAADIYIRRIKEFEEEKDANAPKLDEKWARYLTLWVMLAEQWPVATCYILHSNAEMHSNSNAENVLEIFRNVELAYIKDDNRKGVDGNQVSLGKFLQEMSEISSQKLKQLAYLTVVVNDSLYHEVEMKQSVDLNDTQIAFTVVNNPR